MLAARPRLHHDGMVRGEVPGLRWSEIDLAGRSTDWSSRPEIEIPRRNLACTMICLWYETGNLVFTRAIWSDSVN